MDDAEFVRGPQRLGDLLRDRQRLVERNRPAGEAFGEICSLHEFHDQRGRGACLFEAVDLRDVRVIQRRQRFRLALEPHQPIGIAGERFRQHLQRDVAIEFAVARPIHLAHSACPERAEDFE
jgi:hypothetical protein